jgi:uncharacterized beta-barrel protein YwiB (DUF1934 family)
MEKKEQKVRIRITGTHNRAGSGPETIVSENEGIMTRDGETIILTGSQEMDESGEKFSVSFRITSSRIKMVRKGVFSSVMVFEQGVHHHTPYQTPYGNLDMDVDTGKLTVDLSDSTKITAQVEYSLTMSGQETSHSGIKIEVFI